MACVGLDKPKDVQACAATNTCSDDPVPPPREDAGDAPSPGPDTADLAPPPPDLAPDVGLDVPNDRAPDAADGGQVDADTAPLPDAGQEVAREVARDDVARDLANEDLPRDLPQEVGREVGPEVTADLPVDQRIDQARDLPPDLPPDLPRDIPPDLPPDTSTLGSSLLAYYTCESATGTTTLPDASGKANHGTLAASGSGGYSFRPGKVGNALVLSRGAQGHVAMPAAMFAGITEVTLAVWVNVTSAQNWQRVYDIGVDAKLANNASTGTRYMNLVPKNEGTDLAFAISRDGYSNEQVLTAPSPAIGAWKHVTVVLGTGQASLYVDGVRVTNSATVALRPGDLGTIDYAFLGRSQFTADPYFDGLLDEVRVYGRALTAAEIQALYELDGS